MTLKTTIANCKEVPAGQGVSYGLHYRTAEPTTLALVPVGYADGIPRVATGGPVMVNGEVFPVVGRIAMDQMVIDLGRTGVAGTPDSFLGKEAVLFRACRIPQRGRVGPGQRFHQLRDHHPDQRPRDPQLRGLRISCLALCPSTRIPKRCSRELPSTEAPVWEHDYKTSSAAQTQELARALGGALLAGDLLLLTGELGAGKTTFTQGLGEGLGVRAGIISPTFVLVRIHPALGDRTRPGARGCLPARFCGGDRRHRPGEHHGHCGHGGGVGARTGGASLREPA